jgi:hypothetical protein
MARTLVKTIEDTRRNYFINGDMRLAQRNTSFSAIANGAYSLDRWVYQKSGAMVHTLSQGTDTPTFAQAEHGFRNSLVATLTTPDTSIGAAESCRIEQRIEGYNYQFLAQKTFTVSFWVKATLAGVYCVAARNSGADRSCVQEYTINATNTWEYKTITFPATPTTGTWNYTNGNGLTLAWVLAAGSDFQTTAGAWQTGNFFKTSNQVNGVNTGATSWLMTGVMINEGDSAAPFSLFGGDFQGEVKAAQRYYEKSFTIDFVPGTASDCPGNSWARNIAAASTRVFIGDANTVFKVEKRNSSNTFRIFNQRGDYAENKISVYNGDTNQSVSLANASANQNGFAGYLDALASDTVWGFHWTVDSEI